MEHGNRKREKITPTTGAMMTRLCLAGALCMILLGNSWADSAGKKAQCAIPGEPIRWMAAYCMAVAETDDLESEAVQGCMRSQKAPKFRDLCKEKKFWKKKWCGARVKQGSEKDGISKCAANPLNLPAGVEKGF